MQGAYDYDSLSWWSVASGFTSFNIMGMFMRHKSGTTSSRTERGLWPNIYTKVQHYVYICMATLASHLWSFISLSGVSRFLSRTLQQHIMSTHRKRTLFLSACKVFREVLLSWTLLAPRRYRAFGVYV